MENEDYRAALEEAASALAESWACADAGDHGGAAECRRRASAAIEGLRKRGGEWSKARGEAWRRALAAYSRAKGA